MPVTKRDTEQLQLRVYIVNEFVVVYHRQEVKVTFCHKLQFVFFYSFYLDV